MNKTIIGYLRNPNQKKVLEERAKENGISFSTFVQGDFKIDKEERITKLLGHLEPNSILIIKDICSLGKSFAEMFQNIERIVVSKTRIISIKEKLDISLENDSWKKLFQPFCELIPATQSLLFDYVKAEIPKKK